MDKEKAIEIWNYATDNNLCIRIYNKNGDHVLSYLTCRDDIGNFDLTDPAGEVFSCESWDYTVFFHFLSSLGFERI